MSMADQLLSAKIAAVCRRHCARGRIEDQDQAVAEQQADDRVVAAVAELVVQRVGRDRLIGGARVAAAADDVDQILMLKSPRSCPATPSPRFGAAERRPRGSRRESAGSTRASASDRQARSTR